MLTFLTQAKISESRYVWHEEELTMFSAYGADG